MGASSSVWVVAFSSPIWVVGCGSLKFGVGLMSLWVSQVHRGSLKSGGVGWDLNRCGSWQVVVDCGGSGVEDRGGSACRPQWWRCGDQFFFW